MLALGIDISTKKIALAGIDTNGDLHLHAVHLPTMDRGARRLSAARAVLAQSLKAERWQDTVVSVVEVAWPGFALLSMTAVVMEAVQTQFPGAIVMEVSAASWKRETIGRGTAPKQDCMTHARALGYDGDDQDLADGLCMADAAWSRWNAQVGTAA